MNAEASVPDQKHRRIEDLLPREGYAEIEISAGDFRFILNDVMPGVEWADDAIDMAIDHTISTSE
jgi:hypothetical protein